MGGGQLCARLTEDCVHSWRKWVWPESGSAVPEHLKTGRAEPSDMTQQSSSDLMKQHLN